MISYTREPEFCEGSFCALSWQRLCLTCLLAVRKTRRLQHRTVRTSQPCRIRSSSQFEFASYRSSTCSTHRPIDVGNSIRKFGTRHGSNHLSCIVRNNRHRRPLGSCTQQSSYCSTSRSNRCQQKRCNNLGRCAHRTS